MRGQLNRVIVVFGLLVLLPAVSLVERVHQGAGRRLARWGASVGATACGVRFEVRGASPDSGLSIVVPNHSSPMDIPVLLWADPTIRFMAAADLFRVPLLASAMRALDTVPIDRRDHDRAQRQLDDLVDDERQSGGPGDVAVFAEGGIAPSGGRLPFKSGAFSLAIRTGSQVVPVAITGSDRVLRPRGRLLVRPGVVTIEFLAPVSTVGLTVDDRHALRDHVESEVIEALRAA